jgi:hypothetical protein
MILIHNSKRRRPIRPNPPHLLVHNPHMCLSPFIILGNQIAVYFALINIIMQEKYE